MSKQQIILNIDLLDKLVQSEAFNLVQGDTPEIICNITSGDVAYDLTTDSALLTSTKGAFGWTATGAIATPSSGQIIFSPTAVNLADPGRYTMDMTISNAADTEHLTFYLRFVHVLDRPGVATPAEEDLDPLYVISAEQAAAIIANTAHSSSDGKDHSDVVLNNAHRVSDGSGHGFIDQDVTNGSSPTFDGANITGVSASVAWGAVSGTLSDQSDLQTELDAKLDSNTPITPATKTKITYDADGLITSGADATTADIAVSTNKNYVTDAEAVVIGNTSGTNTGDFAPTNANAVILANGTPNGLTDTTEFTYHDSAIDLVGTNLRIDRDGAPFLHNFSHPTGSTAIPEGFNVFLGETAGNLTVGSGATSTNHGSNLIAIGQNTLHDVTDGYGTVAMGENALENMTTGYNNVAMGTGALRFLNTGFDMFGLGASACYNATSARACIGIGSFALYSNQTGYYNVAIGQNSLQDCTGQNNTAIGRLALGQIIAKDQNVGIGVQAGNKNIAGANNTLTENSTYIGYDTRSATNASDNEIAIGHMALGAGSNTSRLGNASITDAYITGVIHTNNSEGEMYEDNASGSSITITTAGNFYQWVTTTGGINTGSGYVVHSASTDDLVIGSKGEGNYDCSFSGSFSGSINSIVKGAIFVNEVEQTNIKFTRTLPVGVSVNGSFGAKGKIAVSDGDAITARFTSDSNGDTVLIIECNVSITRSSL